MWPLGSRGLMISSGDMSPRCGIDSDRPSARYGRTRTGHGAWIIRWWLTVPPGVSACGSTRRGTEQQKSSVPRTVVDVGLTQ